jgi:hypothetical protein
MIAVVLFIVLSAAVRTDANYVTGSFSMDQETCGGTPLAAAAIPMGKCIQVPDLSGMNVTIPISGSMKATCETNADGSVHIAAQVYATSSACKGLGVPVKYDQASCDTGVAVACSDVAIAAGEDTWPAMGVYFGDASCGAYDAAVAVVPDTCEGASKDDSSGSAVIHLGDDSISALYYSSDDCSGDGTAVETRTATCSKYEASKISAALGEEKLVDNYAMRLFREVLLTPIAAQLGSVVGLRGGDRLGAGASIYSYADAFKALP